MNSRGQYVGKNMGEYAMVKTYKYKETTNYNTRRPKSEVEGLANWKPISGGDYREKFKKRSDMKLNYIDLNIECEVEKTGGELLYNYAEISGLNDRDSTAKNVFSGEDDEDYDVVHKLVDIGGTVFIDGILSKGQDKITDGFCDLGEVPKSGVKVTLSNGTTTTTDSNGRYMFYNLPSEGTYSVTFEYDGVEYIATKYTHGSGSETNDNDARENSSDRNNMNQKFKEISQEFLRTNPSKTITASTISHKGIENTDNLKCINLGLIKRTKVDLSLINDVYKTEINVNDKKEEYIYSAIEKARQSIWFNEDKTQSSTKYYQDIYKTDVNKDKTNNKFEVYVTYKIVITNESSTETALTEIVDYYDKSFTFDKATAKIIKGKESKNLNVNTSDETKFFKIKNDNKISYPNYGNNSYKAVYIRLDKEKLNNADQCIIEVRLKLNNASEVLDEMFNKNEELKMKNYAEIKGFSTEGNIIEKTGVLDRDSQPGNYIIDKIATSEDDNGKTPIIYFRSIAPRVIRGSVWEAINDNIKYGADIKKNTELLQYIENNGIQGIKVELLELQNGKLVLRDNDYCAKTDVKGNYEIKNYVPGDYVIRFTYGGDCKTKSKYTKYNYDGVDFYAMYNGQNYQSTKGNSNENNHKYWYINDTDKRFSDAYDDATMRYLQIEKLKKYSFEEVRKLYNQEDDEYQNETMYAYTGRMELEVEQGKTITNHNEIPYDRNKHTYEIENIDFGLTPRTETVVKIEKYITHVKLTLSDGKIYIDSDIEDIEKGKIKGIKTPGNRSDVTIELEDELVQGAVLEITYEVKVKNDSEPEILTLYKDSENKVIGITYYQEEKEKLIPYEGNDTLFVTNGALEYKNEIIKSKEERTNDIEIKQLVDHSGLLYTDTKLEENKWRLDLDNTKLRFMDKNDKRFKDTYDCRKEATCVLLDKGQVIIKPKNEDKQKIITSTALSPRIAANIDPTYDNNALISILGSNTGRITDITKIHTKSEDTTLLDPLGKKGFSQIEFIICGIITSIFAIGIVLIKKYAINKK